MFRNKYRNDKEAFLAGWLIKGVSSLTDKTSLYPHILLQAGSIMFSLYVRLYQKGLMHFAHFGLRSEPHPRPDFGLALSLSLANSTFHLTYPFSTEYKCFIKASAPSSSLAAIDCHTLNGV